MHCPSQFSVGHRPSRFAEHKPFVLVKMTFGLLLLFLLPALLVNATRPEDFAIEALLRSVENNKPPKISFKDRIADLLAPEENQDYVDSIETCSKLIFGHDLSAPINKLTRFKFAAKMLSVAQCVIVADIMAAPWNVLQDAKRAYNELKWDKSSSFSKTLEQFMSVPIAMLKSILMLPFRTTSRLIGIGFGSLMTYANIAA